jgi:fatty acid desaturase
MIDSSQPSRYVAGRLRYSGTLSVQGENSEDGCDTDDLSFRVDETSGLTSENSDFQELKRRIDARGLMKKQHGYYAGKISLLVGLLAAGLLSLALINHIWWLVFVDAAFLAFVATQMGFMGHDAGHKQVFRSARLNDIVGLIFGNLLLGVSRQWWLDKHNQHHRTPNQMGVDPDLAVLFFLPAGAETGTKKGVLGFIWRHPAVFIFPLTAFGALSLKVRSIPYVLSTDARYKYVEVALIAIHIALFVAVPVYFLSLKMAVAFLVVNLALSGIYMAAVFATNHIGMPVLEKEAKIDFLRRQTLTSRNLRAPKGLDFLFGGLNYQIEHHLFPTMARNNLRQARQIVRDFCVEHAVPYHEVGIGAGYQEILGFFANAGKHVRRLTVLVPR